MLSNEDNIGRCILVGFTVLLCCDSHCNVIWVSFLRYSSHVISVQTNGLAVCSFL